MSTDAWPPASTTEHREVTARLSTPARSTGNNKCRWQARIVDANQSAPGQPVRGLHITAFPALSASRDLTPLCASRPQGPRLHTTRMLKVQLRPGDAVSIVA